jgi:hypothetical protein
LSRRATRFMARIEIGDLWSHQKASKWPIQWSAGLYCFY